MTTKEVDAAHLASQELGVPESDPDLSLVSQEYDEFVDLFSKKEADKLPLH